MGTIHWINVDGTERAEPGEKVPDLEPMQKFVGGYIELVWVLHNDTRTAMFVNEEGATSFRKGYPLPVNQRATEIYHEATRQGRTGLKYRPDVMPKIHGPAILLEGITLE